MMADARRYMAKVQTRKSISISGSTYTLFKKYCSQRKETMSGVVEDLLHQLLHQDLPLPNKTEKKLKVVEQTAQEIEIKAERAVDKARERGELYNGAKVPELDELTKAIRKAQDIFTF